MKKVLLLIMCSFLLYISSCSIGKIKLPDLEGKSREQIEEIMKDYDIEYKFEFADVIIEDNRMLDKFVSYNNGSLKAGDKVAKDQTLTIYTTVLPLHPSLCYELKMDFEWQGKSFINDGVGQVELLYISDGDTAWFRDIYTNDQFKVRFLGIDTPETHAGEDPWGMAASNFTEERLENAQVIVVESELKFGVHAKPTTDTYGRYLGFVWVDGVLLNLEIIENAYSNSTIASTDCPDIYKELFLQASINSMKTGRRFFGEIDPNYDYENRKFK